MLVSKFRTPHVVIFLANLVFVVLLFVLTLVLLRHHLPAAHAQPASGKGFRVVDAPNPHYRASRGRHIDTVVVHFISGINVDARRWNDAQLAMDILKRYHVSAHYLVDRLGTIYRLVDERNVAWHAGGSIMPSPDNRRNVNGFSIGIETIATAKSGFTDAQYRALAHLIQGIEGRYPIRHLVGHDEIAGTRAIRLGLRRDLKEDPGPLFDWGRLHSLLGQAK